jgi:hypothetical protein
LQARIYYKGYLRQVSRGQVGSEIATAILPASPSRTRTGQFQPGGNAGCGSMSGLPNGPRLALSTQRALRRPANTRWVEVLRPARSQRNHRAVTFPPALRFLEVVGYKTLIHTPSKYCFREAMLPNEDFGRPNQPFFRVRFRRNFQRFVAQIEYSRP